ncbi:MAG: lipopolysaccharide biosynthesis protein [Burkholderiaceae bacterium]|nr:lipopolysaccharide biosynthesis protein [Burkholderiaceae bacterium]
MADFFQILLKRRRLVAVVTIAFATAGAGVSLLTPPTYTAKASFLSPQQQNATSAALAALGGLAGGLAGAGGGLKTPSDQYVSLMESVRISDAIIDRFKLMEVYDAKFREDARAKAAKNARFVPSKKDSFIYVEVDDESPTRAAAMANAYIEELQKVTSSIALTEAQQRRMFFERQLSQTKDQLTKMQAALESAGFNVGAMSADAKATADLYAKAKASVDNAQIELDSLRRTRTDSTPEVLRQRSIVEGLTAQLRQLERPSDKNRNTAYINAYRDFKYQEMLLEINAKQYEAAKMDEAREGAMIQVIDVAQPPERRSKPKRVSMTIMFAMFGLIFSSLFVLWRYFGTLPAEQSRIK